MCKDTSGTSLEKEEHICTQRLAEKGIRAFALCGRGVWDAHYRTRWTRGQEGSLEKGSLDFFQVGLPELQMTTGDEGRSDGVVKNIFNSKLGNNAGLVVWNPELLGYLMASLWGKDIGRFDGSARKEEMRLMLRYE